MEPIHKHWTRGGTALTNFPEEDRAMFEKAAALAEEKLALVTQERMEDSDDLPGGALHILSLDQAERSAAALRYWRAFDHVKSEMTGEPLPDYHVPCRHCDVSTQNSTEKP